jgi:hypothetical protein
VELFQNYNSNFRKNNYLLLSFFIRKVGIRELISGDGFGSDLHEKIPYNKINK